MIQVDRVHIIVYAFFSSIRLCEPNVLFCMLQ